ncbi:hypothetical protein DL96DRAFT_1628577 [Flagelloscypha sp. PMI_526]|nr:hypothetical protein DL96DRAFT_1628577 [Flagelloscypha sp. PMI_526]
MTFASFASLPTEIARLILITAATEDKTRSTSIALSLVSKLSQQWVDPFLFRHITLTTRVKVDQYLQLYINNTSIRLATNRFRAWSLSVHSKLVGCQFLKLLSIHPSIQSLFLSWTVPSDADLQELPLLPNLTHISVSFDHVTPDFSTVLYPNFSTGLYSNVTHLDMTNYGFGSFVKHPPFPDLAKLEAIAIGGLFSMDGSLAIALTHERVLCLIPQHVKLVIWFLDVSGMVCGLAADPGLETLSTGDIDSRVVVCLGRCEDGEKIGPDIMVNDLIGDSDSQFQPGIPEDQTFWAVAEAILTKRRLKVGKKNDQ